jgi:hypothetical protein
VTATDSAIPIVSSRSDPNQKRPKSSRRRSIRNGTRDLPCAYFSSLFQSCFPHFNYYLIPLAQLLRTPVTQLTSQFLIGILARKVATSLSKLLIHSLIRLCFFVCFFVCFFFCLYALFSDDFLGIASVEFSSLEDSPVTRTLTLQPRESHPQDSYVKGELVVRLTLDKIPINEREIWRKNFLGGERSNSNSKRTIQGDDSREKYSFSFFLLFSSFFF